MPAIPQAYTPRHLAEKILATRDTLTGERKQVTVLFADIVGSTELIRDLDAEDAQRLLDGAVERMMTAVHRYEGTVSRVMGDGLMAMFGAPVAHEDHAVRACYAALAMLEAVRGYAEDVRQAQGAAIQIRVGLNSGEVIVRLISDDLHMDYTAMGQTVHLASRMEGLARACTALLSPATLALAEGFVEVRPLGPTPVRGLGQPIEVYELTGAGAARTRLEASAARGLTPFVGRQEERAAINRALALAGQGQVVALVAAAGVGKSRLVWEVTHADQVHGWTVLQTGALSYGQATAWLPVIELLRDYFQIERRDDHAVMRDKVTARLQALDPSPESVLPAVLALLDALVEDATWEQLDPPRRRRATLDAVRQVLLRESQLQPLLLVVEDLHWIDTETQALLDSLVEVLPASNILLLVNYRPEYTHAWGGRSSYTQLRIDPLREQGAEELLTILLGSAPGLQALRAHLIQRTDGTPLFLEETVRSLAEIGALVGERGVYRLARSVAEVKVPATVQAVLAARIDRLAPEHKRLLQTAAVVGKDMPLALLREVAELPDDDLRSGLARLQADELLFPTRLVPEPEYTFKHALTHEVTYGSLLQERRRSLHARIIEAIEAQSSDRLDEQAEQLAHHAVSGQVWEKALLYSRQAGFRANARYAHLEATRFYEQALRALEHLPESSETLEHAVDLRLGLRTALRARYEPVRVHELSVEIERFAARLGDPVRRCRALYLLSRSFEERREYARALEVGQQALSLAESLDERVLKIMCFNSLTLTYEYMGEYQRAVDCHCWSLTNYQREPERAWDGWNSDDLQQPHTHMAVLLAELGRFEEAIEHGLEALRLADGRRSPSGRFFANWRLSDVYLRRGDLRRAIPVIYQMLDANASLGNPYPWAPIQLGYAFALNGRSSEALAQLQIGARYAVGEFGGGGRSRWFFELGEAYQLIGHLDEASRWAEQALQLARWCGERGHLAWTLRLAGQIAVSREPAGSVEAFRHFAEALALTREAGMRTLEAHCHLGLGKLYRRIGRLDEASAELATAVTMLSEMEMTFWLPEVEQELAQVRREA